MRLWSWLRGEPRREYYYRKHLNKVRKRLRWVPTNKKVDEWILELRDEETLGFAILQRQRRLETEQKKEEEGQQQQQQQQQHQQYEFRRWRCQRCKYHKEMCSACHEAFQAADIPPPYFNRSPKDFEVKLATLREEFSKHRIRVNAIKEKLNDIRNWWAIEAMVPRWHTDEAGRTFEWVECQRKCADLGGCCGRTCGCCEEVLFEYRRPKLGSGSGSGTDRKMVRILMAEAVDANAALSFWQKLDPGHLKWLFLVIFVVAICNVLSSGARLYLELWVKRRHIRKLRAMPPSRGRDVELGKNEEEGDREEGRGVRRWEGPFLSDICWPLL
ncbi:hypothetical protein BO71DRAFT_355558 [Aspergillus ellipticus CBS 707.79]|uniref:Uncharacterized protein n=1 Tax=Aspergillus ellipticus CBS 707.79 TaxID=1448320 RepID=A0A319DYP2_9EURO|nr:hypothetical protein BO71DRAFT_355558 [Aspergillus ellipticus CBS 707.79]